jgi:hypothetical protein
LQHDLAAVTSHHHVIKVDVCLGHKADIANADSRCLSALGGKRILIGDCQADPTFG